MFNINYNDIKQSKKQYSSKMKNVFNDSYKLHEKISSSLNHSIQSNFTDTTASKSNTTKTFSSRNHKISVNDIKHYPIKKLSYTNFLELRKTKNHIPCGTLEKRFKWQNLKDENIVVYPEIYKKPHKKQFLLKDTFGDGLLGFLNNRKVYDDKPRIRRIRSCYNELSMDDKKPLQHIDINISRRVIDPSYNKEKEIINKKRCFSQSNYIHHKTNGGIKSLFELTPVDIPIKGKKLFKTKSYDALHINLFDINYGRYEMPTHTKKQFFNNRCYYDHIKDQNLISDMNQCWRNKRSRSVGPEFKTDIEFLCYNNIDNLKLRYFGGKKFEEKTRIYRNNNMNKNNKNSKTKTLSKIKRYNKKK